MTKLSIQTQSLNFRHLQLGVRARNNCDELGCRTIEDVRSAVARDVITTDSVGKKTCYEIEEAVISMLQFSNESGTVDWPLYWITAGIFDKSIYLTSNALDNLCPAAQKHTLGRLHLGKACSALNKAGIISIGELIGAAKQGIDKLPNFGPGSIKETISALRALSDSIATDGSVSWVDYALARNFEIIPENGITNIGESFFTNEFPNTCEEVIRSQFNERDWMVFHRRLLVDNSDIETLDAIGQVFDVTRERIRQIERDCLEALRKPLLEDDYEGRSFMLHNDLTNLFRVAKAHFEEVGLPAWSKSKWLDELSLIWGISRKALEPRYRLIAELLNYGSFRIGNGSHEPVLALNTESDESEMSGKRLAKLVEALGTVLSNGDTLDAFDIVKAIKDAAKPAPELNEIPFLANLCSFVETIDGGFYQMKFKHIRSRANQVIRVLREHNEPMEKRDLCREINRRLPAQKRVSDHRNLVNQIVNIQGLQSISKSGFWVLSDWGLETRPLGDLIEEVLEDAGEPMTTDEIGRKVLSLRPGSPASITLLLSTNPARFRKITKGLYALTKWGDSVCDAKILDQKATAEFVRQFLKSKNTDEAPFGDLTKAYCEFTGLEKRSARGILAHHPAVSVRTLDYSTRLASYNHNWESASKPSRRSAPLQVDMITNAALDLLLKSEDGEMPLIDLVKTIETDLQICRPNIYAAIEQSVDIEKISSPGSVFKICRLAA